MNIQAERRSSESRTTILGINHQETYMFLDALWIFIIISSTQIFWVHGWHMLVNNAHSNYSPWSIIFVVDNYHGKSLIFMCNQLLYIKELLFFLADCIFCNPLMSSPHNCCIPYFIFLPVNFLSTDPRSLLSGIIRLFMLKRKEIFRWYLLFGKVI